MNFALSLYGTCPRGIPLGMCTSYSSSEESFGWLQFAALFLTYAASYVIAMPVDGEMSAQNRSTCFLKQVPQRFKIFRETSKSVILHNAAVISNGGRGLPASDTKRREPCFFSGTKICAANSGGTACPCPTRQSRSRRRPVHSDFPRMPL